MKASEWLITDNFGAVNDGYDILIFFKTVRVVILYLLSCWPADERLEFQW